MNKESNRLKILFKVNLTHVSNRSIKLNNNCKSYMSRKKLKNFYKKLLKPIRKYNTKKLYLENGQSNSNSSKVSHSKDHKNSN